MTDRKAYGYTDFVWNPFVEAVVLKLLKFRNIVPFNLQSIVKSNALLYYIP